MKKYSLAIITGFMILCASAIMPGRAYAIDEADDNKIQDGVYVDNVDLSGMSKEEASKAVDDFVNSYYDEKITLGAGKEETEVEVADLNLEWLNKDIANEALGIGRKGNVVNRYKQLKDLEHEPIVLNVEFGINDNTAKKLVEKIAKNFNQEAVDAGIKRENGNFIITEGHQGIIINEDDSIRKIKEFFSDGWLSTNSKIELVSQIEEPKGSVEELSKIKDLLGSFSTVCGSGATGRIQNIINGTGKINGSIVYPGEEFSADAAMGPYDASTGYALGGAYENGTVVQSYGGGICQVSSTLYNAVIKAELEVTQRANHSMTVSYVEPSMDAAIAGTWKDLKFKNNTDTPIFIEGYVKGGTVYFNIYGKETRDPNRTIEFVSETLSTTPPGVTIHETDAPFGTITVASAGHTGIEARLWKVVYVSGKEVSREIFNTSKYKASERVLNVGTRTDNATAAGALRDAINANSEDACNSIIAQYGSSATPKEEPSQPQDPNQTGDTTPADNPDNTTTGDNGDGSTNPGTSVTE